MSVKLPEFWKAGGEELPYVWGFGYWSSGPESLPGDGLLTYHNLEGKLEKEREADLVVLQPSQFGALVHWLIIRLHYEKRTLLEIVY